SLCAEVSHAYGIIDGDVPRFRNRDSGRGDYGGHRHGNLRGTIEPACRAEAKPRHFYNTIMLILWNTLFYFAKVLDILVTTYSVILFARVILSWVSIPYNQIVHMIYQLTDPVLRPIRRRLPMSWGIDLS